MNITIYRDDFRKIVSHVSKDIKIETIQLEVLKNKYKKSNPHISDRQIDFYMTYDKHTQMHIKDKGIMTYSSCEFGVTAVFIYFMKEYRALKKENNKYKVTPYCRLELQCQNGFRASKIVNKKDIANLKYSIEIEEDIHLIPE